MNKITQACKRTSFTISLLVFTLIPHFAQAQQSSSFTDFVKQIFQGPKKVVTPANLNVSPPKPAAPATLQNPPITTYSGPPIQSPASKVYIPPPQTSSSGASSNQTPVLVPGNINPSPANNLDLSNFYPAPRWGRFGIMGHDKLNGGKHSKYKTVSNRYLKIKHLGTQFYVREDASQLLIQLSAVGEVQKLGSILKIRALVDGNPTNEVMFATGTQSLASSALFIARNVSAGPHDIQVEFMVFGGGEASIADPTLYVQSGKADASGQRMATIYANPYSEVRGSEWVNVENNLQLSTQADEKIEVLLGIEAANSEPQGLQVRVLVDGDPVFPSQMLLTGAPYVASRGVTFTTQNLNAGNHRIQLQARSWGGLGTIYAYSMAAVAVKYIPNLDNNAFESSEDQITPREVRGDGWSTIPGMTHDMRLASNSEIAGTINLELAALPAGIPIQVRMKLAAGDGEPEVISIPEYRNIQNNSPKFGSLSLSYLIKGVNLKAEENRRTISFEWKAGESELANIVEAVSEAVVANDGRVGANLGINVPLGKHSMVLRSERVNYPDLTGGIQMVPYPEPARGTYNVLTIVASRNMLAPQTYQLTDGGITVEQITNQLFGEHSVRDYYSEISNGKIQMLNAGVLGPYAPAYPAIDAACQDANGKEIVWEPDGCDSPCSNGHVTRGRRAWLQLLQQADPLINFANFDSNGDGVVDAKELAIVFAEPAGPGPADGATRDLLYCDNNPAGRDFVLDGVILKMKASSWTFPSTGLSKNDFSVAAHELGHQIWDFDDLYSGATNHNYAAAFMSLMSFTAPSPFLDGVQRLMQGSMAPQLVSESGDYTLDAVKLGGKGLILPRLDGKSAEFFLLENREDPGVAALGTYDEGIRDSGIAIWHFIDGYAINRLTVRDALPRCYTPGVWAGVNNDPNDSRRQLRLIHPGLLFGFSNALWDQNNGEIQDAGNEADCGTPAVAAIPASPGVAAVPAVPAVPGTPLLQWADETPSGYDVRFTSAKGDHMTVNVHVNLQK